MHATNWYPKLAKSAARFCGRPKIFAPAVATTLLWAIAG